MPASHTTAPQVLNALNMSAVAPVAGYGGVAIQVQGTFTGTITFEASVQGSEFEPFRVTKSDNSTAVTTATTTGVYVGTVAGYSVIRARMSSYSNGGASVMIGAAPAAPGGAGGGGGSGTDVNLIEVGGAGISLGETTMANSLPVVIASDQTPIPITGSISATNPSVGATGADVPTDATYIGVSNAAGDLTGLASVAVDLNSTTPPVVPVHGFYHALPGAGGPVVGGTTTNPIRIAGTGTAGTANAGVATIQGIASMTPVQVSQATAANLNATVVLAAGSAVVGHVITDTGSTTAVTGNVTVVQPTGTNLHAVIDSGSTTAVTGNVTVVQPTGTSLHAVIDTGSTTAVTGNVTVVQGTATSLKAEVIGAGTAGTANAGVVTVQGITSMTPLLVTPAANSSVNLTQLAGNAVSAGNGGTGTGVLRVAQVNDGTGVLATVTNVATIGTSVTPGTAAANLGKAEDAGHTSGDVGVMALAVRNDTPNTAVTNTDADYSQVSVDRLGQLRVAPIESDFAVVGSAHVKKYYTNAGAVTDGIVWSPAAGKRWYVTSIFVNVSAAATVTLEDDLTGGDSPIWKAELAANSGWSSSFPVPWFSGEDAADLLVTTSAGNVYITVVGYEI